MHEAPDSKPIHGPKVELLHMVQNFNLDHARWLDQTSWDYRKMRTFADKRREVGERFSSMPTPGTRTSCIVLQNVWTCRDERRAAAACRHQNQISAWLLGRRILGDFWDARMRRREILDQIACFVMLSRLFGHAREKMVGCSAWCMEVGAVKWLPRLCANSSWTIRAKSALKKTAHTISDMHVYEKNQTGFATLFWWINTCECSSGI